MRRSRLFQVDQDQDATENRSYPLDGNDSESIISIDGSQITPIDALERIKIAEEKRRDALRKINEINTQVEEVLVDIMPQ